MAIHTFKKYLEYGISYCLEKGIMPDQSLLFEEISKSMKHFLWNFSRNFTFAPTDEMRSRLLQAFILLKCPGGEIGRRTRFRCERCKAWGFESLLGHI